MRSKPLRMSQHMGALKPLPSRLSFLRESPSSKIISFVLLDLLFAFVIHTSAQGQTASPAQFVDVTGSAGIKFTHFKGNKGISINLEEFGPGVCVSDFNRDGWQDIYFVNGLDRYQRGIT